jgi:hypothetical protein
MFISNFATQTLQYSPYLHTIYIVLGITNKVEMI